MACKKKLYLVKVWLAHHENLEKNILFEEKAFHHLNQQIMLSGSEVIITKDDKDLKIISL